MIVADESVVGAVLRWLAFAAVTGLVLAPSVAAARLRRGVSSIRVPATSIHVRTKKRSAMPWPPAWATTRSSPGPGARLS